MENVRNITFSIDYKIVHNQSIKHIQKSMKITAKLIYIEEMCNKINVGAAEENRVITHDRWRSLGNKK